MTEPLCLIRAPSNLGLRPRAPGHEPGTWRAPAALTAAGLVEATSPARIIDLDRPTYDPAPQAGTRLYNGHRIRAFSLEVALEVEAALARCQFPLIVGGDCSILLGALAGVRQTGPVSLVHIDGHSDFRHPGNYDSEAELGAVAGMDLALATGRGEPLLVEWPGVQSPLVPDRQIIQIGEREGDDPDYAWADIANTAMTRIDVNAARRLCPAGVFARTTGILEREPSWPFWLHFDVDVLDRAVMPAVDTPGSPGIELAELTALLGMLTQLPRCYGMTLTIFDPDLDPCQRSASLLVKLLASVFG